MARLPSTIPSTILVSLLILGSGCTSDQSTVDDSDAALAATPPSAAFDDARHAVPAAGHRVVHDSAELRAAIRSHRAGEVIELAEGPFDGEIVVDRGGTAKAPLRTSGTNWVLDNRFVHPLANARGIRISNIREVHVRGNIFDAGWRGDDKQAVNGFYLKEGGVFTKDRDIACQTHEAAPWTIDISSNTLNGELVFEGRSRGAKDRITVT